ncbi:hypothetical protein B0J13DRAFT_585248 [Dactylonectria estremocensis]|uniref:EH domain-containing protein n=1 Tax=Dactylonectria estremocensis TaxID=1079267 RepID=A0A9P9EVB9_9HYPO|nr:hypothetical protein B0J13DRAFT_585248 [Dactylonectria estremocensis]
MNPVAQQATGSTDPAATALRGASLAFQKKKPAPPPPKRDNGALTAATTSAGRPRSPVKHLGAHSTGGSVVDPEVHGGGARIMHQLGASPSQQLQSGYQHSTTKADPKSASFIAATLAASRNASPTPKVRTPRRRTSVGAASSSSSGEVVDSGSIAPMGSLISMFEQTRAGDPVKRLSPRRSPARSPANSNDSIAEVPEPPITMAPEVKPKPKPKLKPKPRPSTPPQPITQSAPVVLSPKPRRPSKPALKPMLRPSTPPQIVTRAPIQILSPPSPKPSRRSPKLNPKQQPPTPPKPRGSNKPTTKAKQAVQDQAPAVTPRRSTPRQATPRQATPKLATPKLTGSKSQAPVDKRPTTANTVSSDDTFVSASSTQSPERPSPPPLPRHRIRQPSFSMPPSPSRDIRRHRPKNSSVTSLPLDSLADAIMASSLASARLTPHNTGGSLSAPTLPRRQRSPRMMQTLRQPPKLSDDEGDRHKKGPLRKLHTGKKHTHHEGSRKRWREEITPRERKRYEAVWASNRGVLIDLHSPSNASRAESSEFVVNLVVREVWKRSRLPVDELAEVWDLVDSSGHGVLGRQQFVVGMWLIDQRLRGRKIPAKVSASVWGSANGMKVVNPKTK